MAQGFLFFNRPDADNVFDSIHNTIKALRKESMISLGMDGLNSDWKILRTIQDKRKSKGFSIFEDIGICGLHVI